MTKDTERAMVAIMPIADILNIIVVADNSCLYCDGQAIAISGNSTYATVKEFIGFAMEKICNRPDSHFVMTKETSDSIHKYWVSKETIEKIRNGLYQEETEK